jgi:hypothetical protein
MNNNLPWSLTSGIPATIPAGTTVPAGTYITPITTTGGHVYTTMPAMPPTPPTPFRRNSMIRMDRACPLCNHVMSATDGIPNIMGHLNDAHQALRAYRIRIGYTPIDQQMDRIRRIVAP